MNYQVLKYEESGYGLGFNGQRWYPIKRKHGGMSLEDAIITSRNRNSVLAVLKKQTSNRNRTQ